MNDADFKPETIAAHDARRVADVLNAVRDLPVRERVIVVGRFGLCDGRPRSIAALGLTWHMTPERVREIEATALRRIAEATR